MHTPAAQPAARPATEAPSVCRGAGGNRDAGLAAPLTSDSSRGKSLHPSKPEFPLCRRGESQKPLHSLKRVMPDSGTASWQERQVRQRPRPALTGVGRDRAAAPTRPCRRPSPTFQGSPWSLQPRLPRLTRRVSSRSS